MEMGWMRNQSPCSSSCSTGRIVVATRQHPPGHGFRLSRFRAHPASLLPFSFHGINSHCPQGCCCYSASGAPAAAATVSSRCHFRRSWIPILVGFVQGSPCPLHLEDVAEAGRLHEESITERGLSERLQRASHWIPPRPRSRDPLWVPPVRSTSIFFSFFPLFPSFGWPCQTCVNVRLQARVGGDNHGSDPWAAALMLIVSHGVHLLRAQARRVGASSCSSSSSSSSSMLCCCQRGTEAKRDLVHPQPDPSHPSAIAWGGGGGGGGGRANGQETRSRRWLPGRLLASTRMPW